LALAWAELHAEKVFIQKFAEEREVLLAGIFGDEGKIGGEELENVAEWILLGVPQGLAAQDGARCLKFLPNRLVRAVEKAFEEKLFGLYLPIKLGELLEEIAALEKASDPEAESRLDDELVLENHRLLRERLMNDAEALALQEMVVDGLQDFEADRTLAEALQLFEARGLLGDHGTRLVFLAVTRFAMSSR
jgi:hypothetical protein